MNGLERLKGGAVSLRRTSEDAKKRSLHELMPVIGEVRKEADGLLRNARKALHRIERRHKWNRRRRKAIVVGVWLGAAGLAAAAKSALKVV